MDKKSFLYGLGIGLVLAALVFLAALWGPLNNVDYYTRKLLDYVNSETYDTSRDILAKMYDEGKTLLNNIELTTKDLEYAKQGTVAALATATLFTIILGAAVITVTYLWRKIKLPIPKL
ncbi:hypothetical protein J4526_01815 [Desulfurococcaceae archaeon MEX13E-LK6-19]|nr:hypothetical protein J4526_01815 [Desulfurococcaceae archaeon MEX13E-LK6-19]